MTFQPYTPSHATSFFTHPNSPSVLDMHSFTPFPLSTLHLTSGSSTSFKLLAAVAKCIYIVAECCARTSREVRCTSAERRVEEVSSKG